MFIRALAQRAASSSPLPIAVCPGFCASELGWRELHFYEKPVMWLTERLITHTAEEGSRQLLWAALSPNGTDNANVEDLKGAFVMHNQAFEPSDFVVSEAGKNAQDQLWVSALSSIGPGRIVTD